MTEAEKMARMLDAYARDGMRGVYELDSRTLPEGEISDLICSTRSRYLLTVELLDEATEETNRANMARFTEGDTR